MVIGADGAWLAVTGESKVYGRGFHDVIGIYDTEEEARTAVEEAETEELIARMEEEDYGKHSLVPAA